MLSRISWLWGLCERRTGSGQSGIPHRSTRCSVLLFQPKHLVRSPRKSLFYIIFKQIILDQSIQKAFCLILNTEALTLGYAFHVAQHLETELQYCEPLVVTKLNHICSGCLDPLKLLACARRTLSVVFGATRPNHQREQQPLRWMLRKVSHREVCFKIKLFIFWILWASKYILW